MISAPYQLRSGYIYTVLTLVQPFEGSLEADVAPSDNECDTPGGEEWRRHISILHPHELVSKGLTTGRF